MGGKEREGREGDGCLDVLPREGGGRERYEAR